MNEIREERFEFKLTVNNNIICQRYFKINSFNETSVSSVELREAIDYCVGLINADLTSKSRAYTWHTAPMVFNDENEMRNWFSDPKHRSEARLGEAIFLRNSKREFTWNGESVIECEDTINDGEYTSGISDETPNLFKFTFLDSGKEVCSRVWSGNYYPKFVRNGVDLSNKRGKFKTDDITRLNFESSLLFYMGNDKPDLVPIIIKEICDVCTHGNSWYTTTEDYKTLDANNNYVTENSKVYDLSIERSNKKLFQSYERYFRKKTNAYFRS